jgi:alpha-mannosidase
MTTQAGARASVFAIGNAHIDPVWIWDWREGMREVVATFTAAADRLDNCEDLFFTASSAAYYAWVQQMDPLLFERVKKHVHAGRWNVVGGEWVEPDCNLPSGEAVCRHLLYSQRYFHKAFGIPASIGYNIDSFGHAGSLPQLLTKAGLRGYVMMRPQQHERDIPVSLFNWRGIDGTEIPTYRIPIAYTTGQQADRSEAEVVRERATSLVERAEAEKRPLMFFFGVGDHGGGPTRAAIEELRRLEASDAGSVVFSTPSQYFDVALGAGSMPLETVEGDLHMHAAGCYSVVSWMKALNARSERALVEAERLAALAELATGRPFRVNEELASAWARVLFNQFHDSLGGTCTAEVHDQLREFYGYALAVADDVATRATQTVSTRVDTWVEEAARSDRFCSLKPYVEHYPVPVVVFNPLSWDVQVPIVLAHQAAAVTDDGHRPVSVQPVPSGEGTRYGTHGGGLACISDVTYAYDLSDGRLRLTILRSPRWADHGAPWPHDRGIEPSYTDQGTHRVSLVFIPHAGDWASAQIPRRAEEHCTDFRVVTETWHKATVTPNYLGPNYRGIAVEPDNVAVPVLKRAEDGTGWVARVVEVAGRPTQARFTVEGLGREWEGTLGSFEVKTLLFPDGGGSDTVETDIPELHPWK